MKSEQRNTNKTSNFFYRILTGCVVVVLVITTIVTFSKTAHAGLVSLVSSLFSGESVSAKTERGTSDRNSQTVEILRDYAVNIDPNSERTSDIIPITNDDTLNADLASSNSTSTDTSNLEISSYIVRQGDTISSVAKMFKVSTNTILWANNLTGKSTLKVGQTLAILPISGVSYTVKKGETINGIASRCNADVGDILAYNDLTISSKIKAGDTLIIPDADPDGGSNVGCGAIKPTIAKSTTKTASNEPLLDGWNWPSYPGYFARPISGGRETQHLHGHNAVDFADVRGTPILASAGGTVIVSKKDGGWNGGYGNYVVVSHANKSQTLYAHMAQVAVNVGQAVSQGDVLGNIGMTGKTTGPHVHFEIRGAKNPF
jgi:murein DD-endopeptidase MepM/ murein hydrolase activator NlpD